MALLGAAPFAGALVARAQGPKSLVENTSARDRIRERHFPNVVLTTHEGRKVRFYDDLIENKIVVINFMYVKCEEVCPGITANLVKLQKLLGSRLGRDIFMYSFTLKPEQDSPQVLRRYAEAYHAKKGLDVLNRHSRGHGAAPAQAGFHRPGSEAGCRQVKSHRKYPLWQRAPATMGLMPGAIQSKLDG